MKVDAGRTRERLDKCDRSVDRLPNFPDKGRADSIDEGKIGEEEALSEEILDHTIGERLIRDGSELLLFEGNSTVVRHHVLVYRTRSPRIHELGHKQRNRRVEECRRVIANIQRGLQGLGPMCRDEAVAGSREIEKA